MKVYVIVILFFSLISCRQQTPASGWKKLDLAVFTIRVPSAWSVAKTIGNDRVGKITDGIDTLFYSYGDSFSSDTENVDSRQLMAYDTVNGLPAFIIVPINPGNSFSSINFYHVPNSINRFNMNCNHSKNPDTLIQSFKSISFDVSNSRINPPLTKNKFKAPPYHLMERVAAGDEIVSSYCFSCHAINNLLIGPALRDMDKKYSVDWIYTFLKNPKVLKRDTFYFPSSKDKIDHPAYNFSRDDIQNILYYIQWDEQPHAVP